MGTNIVTPELLSIATNHCMITSGLLSLRGRLEFKCHSDFWSWWLVGSGCGLRAGQGRGISNHAICQNTGL
jgi:hypothetical protein